MTTSNVYALPLEGLTVLDFSQFLSGPCAALRLADLGARVIKIERPAVGDACRSIWMNDLANGRGSVVFQTINRNKLGVALDLKAERDREAVASLVREADVLIENFRPGTMRRLGLGYEEVAAMNPRLVYGSVSGYGPAGPFAAKPGQDLLIQAISGLMWLTGSDGDPPTPVGQAIADNLAGCHLVQGILACLVRRASTGRGGYVEVSLLESLLDFQFEGLTTYLNDGGRPPARGPLPSAHPYLAAPYGVYPTRDGFLAIAMAPLSQLGTLMGLPDLGEYEGSAQFEQRRRIVSMVSERIRQRSTAEWLRILEPADIWCAEVFDWARLLDHPGFEALDMLQTVGNAGPDQIRTTRCPIRIDGQVLKAPLMAPLLGEHTAAVVGGNEEAAVFQSTDSAEPVR